MERAQFVANLKSSYGFTSVSQARLDAVRAAYEAKYQAASNDLMNLLCKTVGIGEHVKVVDDMVKLVDEIDHASSCIDTIEFINKCSNVI